MQGKWEEEELWGRRGAQRDQVWEWLNCCCCLWRWRKGVAKQGMEADLRNWEQPPQPARKWRAQSYNQIQLNSTNRMNDLVSWFIPRGSKKESSLDNILISACETRVENQPSHEHIWPTETYKYYMQTNMEKTTKSTEEHEVK